MHFIVQKCFHLVYFYLFIFLAFGTSQVLKRYLWCWYHGMCHLCLVLCLSHFISFNPFVILMGCMCVYEVKMDCLSFPSFPRTTSRDFSQQLYGHSSFKYLYLCVYFSPEFCSINLCTYFHNIPKLLCSIKLGPLFLFFLKIAVAIIGLLWLHIDCKFFFVSFP